LASKKKKKAKTPAEKIQSDHSAMVRGVFRQAGFKRITSLCDKVFTYDGQKSDFDEIFVYENVLVCIEVTATSKIPEHLKPKKIVYDKVQKDGEAFVKFYCEMSSELQASIGTYEYSDVLVRIVYASRYPVEASHKSNVPNPVYLDYPTLRYLKSTAETIRWSARHELLEFLGVPDDVLGRDGVVGIAEETTTYIGSVLPEASSNFESGFKVVSFYMDPLNLLERAYVLRRDGWRQSYSLYQRLLSKDKIDGIRKYLKQQKRVFVNNIIVTLPSETKLLDSNNKNVDPKDIKRTRQVKITVPRRHNSVGIIDGQHRTYAYFEDASDDSEIAKLRLRQNLLITGIIYPEGTSLPSREKFEARLFLEINSTQTTAKSNLKQAIGLILDPFAPESIAARVLETLDRGSGPLSGQVERYFFDKDMLKPTSIISYGLRPLVKLSGADSLYAKWAHSEKGSLADQKSDLDLLQDYVAFCVGEINALLTGFRTNLSNERWTTNKNVEGRALTTTFVNAMLIVLRLLIENSKTGTQSYYLGKLVGIDNFDAKNYHSSQYGAMAKEIVKDYFGIVT
jgi:DGQHR domain-containing protein